MKPKGPEKIRRRGMSLLELVVASSMLALLMTSVAVLLRTGRQVWEAHEADYRRVEAAQATLRHVVREVRQAESVAAISAAGDSSGQLALLMPDGTLKVWDHDGATDTVNYGVNAANSLLAEEITGLAFAGFQADGVTAAATADEVQMLQIEVNIARPPGAAGGGTFRSWAWLRSW
jgi:prepilin-type N-terminal cleavage/methylation domain-containing protein